MSTARITTGEIIMIISDTYILGLAIGFLGWLILRIEMICKIQRKHARLARAVHPKEAERYGL